MVIHSHHSVNPIAGDTKRVINIDSDVAGILSDQIIEVEFIPLRSLKSVARTEKFMLSPKVIKKYHVLFVSHLGIINDIWVFLFLAFVFIKYKPFYYIEEWELPRFIKSLVALLSKSTRVVLDIHGSSPEEYEYINNKKSLRLENLEKRSVKRADKIICQSDEMKRHLLRKYDLAATDILVFRCGVDTSIFYYSDEVRDNIRKDLGIKEGELLFVYSGGMHKWQKVGDTLAFFNKYHEFNSHSRMLVLTKDIDGLNRIIEENRLSDLKDSMLIKSLPYSEVPKYLCAADFAFLLRDNVVMNAVASPTKLGEYMACGLPVISTEVANKWVTEQGMPYIIPYTISDLTEISSYYRTHSKTEIIDYANNHMSLDIDRRNSRTFFGIY